MKKGAHLAPNFNLALVNELRMDFWVGTDGVLPCAWEPARNAEIANVNGEYWHRAVNWLHVSAIANIRDFGVTNWILTNEYDLHYNVPDSVAIIEQLVAAIGNAYANRPVTPQLYLNMGSNVTDLTHHTLVWNALLQTTRDRINGFTAHRYRQDLSGVNYRTDMRQGRAWMNARGLNDRQLICGEYGLDAAVYDTEAAAAFIESVWDAMRSVAWCDGLLWYTANVGELNYRALCNDNNTKLTKAGRSFRDLRPPPSRKRQRFEKAIVRTF